MSARHRGWLLLGSSCLLLACSSGPSEDQPGSSASPLCTPDPELIAEARACRADDQCPCGSHCELGKCAAQCSSKDDCDDGSRCDAFGRCRAAGDHDKLRGISAEPSGRLTSSAANLHLAANDSSTFVLRADEADSGPIRMKASAGYQVECDDGKWHTECVDPSLDARASRNRRVRKKSDSTATSGAVDVFYGSRAISFSVVDAAQPASAPLSGVYSGWASLTGSTVGDLAALTNAESSPGIAVPIQAEVFENGRLLLTDSLYGLSPEGRLIGQLSAEGDDLTGSASFPRFVLERTALTQKLSSNVLASDAGASFRHTGSSLTIDLPLAYEGLWPGDDLPRAHWVLSLDRNGDASGQSAPALPKSVAAAGDDDAASTPSDWAAALTAGFEAWTDDSSTVDREQLLLTWQATPGNRSLPRRLDACTETGRSLAARLAAADEWRSVSFEPETNVAPDSIPNQVQSGKNALLGLGLSAVSASYVHSASIANVATEAADGVVPCAFRPEPSPVYCYDGLANTSVPQLAPVDRCAEIADELQCHVQDGSGSIEFDLQLNTSNQLGATSCVDAAKRVKGSVTKVCVLPTVAWNCGPLVSCAEDSGNLSYSPGADASALLAVGGDLSCGAGTRSLGTEAELRRNQPGNTDTPAAVVENALDDLAVLRSSPVTPLPTALALDAPRLLVALEYATEADRARGADAALPASPKATRFALRLLQQWLGMHALIAHEASQHWQVPDSITGIVPDPLFPSAKGALSRSLDGYALLLHPRFARALAGMTGSALAQPDYRADWLANVPESPNDQQPEGLPVALCNTVEAQLELADVVLDVAWPAQDAEALELTGRAARSALLVLTLARDLHARAATAQTPLAWQLSYVSAAQSATALLRRVLGRAAAMQAGQNPLGIEDIDLPLYFYGADADPAARFSAISDYLLGNGADGTGGGWASILVKQASDAADAVGPAYTTQVTRQYQAALSKNANQDRLDDIRRHWGDLIANSCGLPDGMTTQDILEDWQDFNGNTCYFASDRADCRVDLSHVDDALDDDTIRYHLCVGAELKLSSGIDIYQDPNLNQLMRVLPVDQIKRCSKLPNCDPSREPCLQCTTRLDYVTTASLAALNLSRTTPDQLQSAKATCAKAYPAGRQILPSLDSAISASPLSRADCYRGTLGDAAFGLLGAQKDLELARSQYSEHLDAYDIEMNGCLIKVDANVIGDRERERFNGEMKSLRSSKAHWDEGAAIAAGVKDCATAMTTAQGFATLTAGVSTTGGVIACGAAIAESVCKVAAINAQKNMDDMQAVHDDFVTKLDQETDIKLCINEAHQELVGLRTASQQIERAAIDLAHAQSTLSGGVGSAQLAYAQGRAALATAQGRSVRPPALDSWVERDIDTFIRLMHQARRVTYLAERAVEYEYQSSLSARQDILTAKTPADLASVLTSLKDTSGTLGINGHRPSSLKIVLSLRQHLMQLYDGTKAPSGEQRLTDEERFQLLLNDRRFAVYQDGKYAGQRIPFSLTPLQALGGDTKGISVFGDTDCAERIWSVNASILGGEALQRGTDSSTFTRVDLLKANTFFSQWCDRGKTDEPFQIASVRPSRNLFRDPEFGLSGAVTAGGGAQDELSLFSRARIQAYFNVARDKLESDDYANGDTSELAARGLFGDYALFFPVGVLSVVSADKAGNVSYGDGLNLSAIDDILLRLDYVSVAR